MLATLLQPTSGRVSVSGLDVVREPHAVRRKIGYMPDFFGVYDDLTASEYLHFFAAAYKIPSAKRRVPRISHSTATRATRTPSWRGSIS